MGEELLVAGFSPALLRRHFRTYSAGSSKSTRNEGKRVVNKSEVVNMRK
jgi:hypothetical protein